MAVTNQRRRSWIRTLFELAEEDHITFRDRIKLERRNAAQAGFSGVIQSMSGNGISSAFVGMTVADAEDAIGWIEDLYSKAVDDLAGQTPAVSDPTDTQIRDTMLALVPQRMATVRNDFSGLRP